MFSSSPQLPSTAEHVVIIEHSSEETMLGTSRKLGGAAKHLIDSGNTYICWLSFESYES